MGILLPQKDDAIHQDVTRGRRSFFSLFVCKLSLSSRYLSRGITPSLSCQLSHPWFIVRLWLFANNMRLTYDQLRPKMRLSMKLRSSSWILADLRPIKAFQMRLIQRGRTCIGIVRTTFNGSDTPILTLITSRCINKNIKKWGTITAKQDVSYSRWAGILSWWAGCIPPTPLLGKVFLSFRAVIGCRYAGYISRT